MTAPPCNCSYLSTIVVWTRITREPKPQRYYRCTHPSGPHPMYEWCPWKTPKTEGAME